MSDAASDNQKSDGYTGLQIALHWAVVVLVIGQWLTSSAIPRTHNPLLLPSAMDLFLHAIHNYAGLAIGALVLLRIALRQRNLQMAVTDDARWSLRLSQAVHCALSFPALSGCSRICRLLSLGVGGSNSRPSLECYACTCSFPPRSHCLSRNPP